MPSPPAVPRPRRQRVVGFLVFASGTSALVYELLWVRKVALITGVHAHAVGTVLASFFAGMAAGSFVFGERAESSRHPLRTYAFLEIGVALAAAAVSWILDHPVALHDVLARVGTPSGALFPLVRFGFTFALLCAPTFLMGGTLPVLSRSVTLGGEPLGREIGRIYALNTLGAVCGTLLSAFVLVPSLGVNVTLGVAVGLNALVGLVAFAYAGGSAIAVSAATTGSMRTRPSDGRALALGLYAVAGFTGLAYEVVWTRILVQLLQSTLLGLALVLASFLIGIVLGSWVLSRRVDTLGSPWRIYAFVQLAIAFSTILAFVLLRGLFDWWSGTVEPALLARGFAVETVWFLKVSLVPLGVLAVPTFMIGLGFPLVVALVGRHATIGSDVGRLYFLNTLGGVCGSLAASFVLVPWLGTQVSLLVLVTLNVMAGVAATLREADRRGVGLATAGVAIAALATIALLIPSDFVARTYFRRFPGRVVFHEEGVEGTVVVYEQELAGHRWKRLVINGSSNTGDIMASLRYMRLQAHLPVLLHPGTPADALVICFGTGITYGSLFQQPGLGRRVCVDLSPAVIRSGRLFAASNGAVLDRPGAEIVVADGRNFLLADPSRFDVITLEPPPPTDAGTVNLYTREFYQLAKTRLRPDGVMAQWLPLYVEIAELKTMVAAFLAEFPHASLWTTERQETLLVGAADALPIDYPRLAARLAVPEVAHDLEAIGIRSAPELLSLFLMDDRGLRSFTEESTPLTDDQPRLEYSLSSLGMRDYPRTLAYLLAHRTPIAPYLTNLPDPNGVLAEINRHAGILDAFYRAGIAFGRGDTDTSNRLLADVYAADPENAYFTSFLDPTTARRLREGAAQ
jgi:predicted membrane-bound spermidine synthase